MARLKYYSKKTNAWETVDSTFGTGNVKTVNGVEPDANGNIEIAVPGMPEINYPVTSVNGMTGDVVIEVGSGQNAVQSSWAQNDPTQPDYVKNRTHWEEGKQTIIVWDGVTEGKAEWDGCYKVSDAIPSISEMVGGKIIFPEEGEPDHEIEFTRDDIDDATDDIGGYFVGDFVAVCLSVVDGFFPETGVYITGGWLPRGTTIVYCNHTIHQLDEKFIPDSIARKDDVSVFLITLTMGDNVEDDTGAHDYSCRADRTYDEVNAAFVAGKHIVLRYDSNVYNFSNYTNYENFTLAFVENGEFHFTYVAYGESPYQCIKSGEVVLDSQGNWAYTLIHKQILPTSDAEDEPQMLLGDKYGWFTNPLFCHEVPSVTEENNGAFIQVVNGVWTAVNLTDVSTEGA